MPIDALIVLFQNAVKNACFEIKFRADFIYHDATFSLGALGFMEHIH